MDNISNYYRSRVSNANPARNDGVSSSESNQSAANSTTGAADSRLNRTANSIASNSSGRSSANRPNTSSSGANGQRTAPSTQRRQYSQRSDPEPSIAMALFGDSYVSNVTVGTSNRRSTTGRSSLSGGAGTSTTRNIVRSNASSTASNVRSRPSVREMMRITEHQYNQLMSEASRYDSAGSEGSDDDNARQFDDLR